MIAKFSVKKPMTVLVGVVLVIILGVVAFTRMTPDLLPNIDLPYVMIITSYIGASPEEVEDTITKPIEQNVATLDHVKTIASTSGENFSMVMLEFSDKADMDAASMNIREKLNLLQNGWNDSVGTPTILKLNPNMIPLSVVAVSRAGADATEVSSFYENQLLTELEGVEGVASVSATGLIEETVNVLLREDLMQKKNAEIRAAIDEEFLEGEEKLSDSEEELKEAMDDVAEGQENLDKAAREMRTAKDDIVRQFADAREELDTQIPRIRAAAEGLKTKIQSIENLPRVPANEKMIDNLPELYDSYKDTCELLATLEAQRAGLHEQEKAAIKQLYGAKKRLADGQETLDETREKLTDSQKDISDAKEDLVESKEQAYQGADMTNLLSISSVGGILSAENFSMPAGYADGSGQDWLIYVGDKLTDPEEIQNLVLFDLDLDGLEPIKLSDVADVIVTDNADDAYAKINGENGVLISFFKQSGYATATVSENLEKKYAELEAEYEGLSFDSLMDQGDYIRIVINSVLGNLALGAGLAVLILMLFLMDLRPTGVVAVSIPVSLTFAIVLMYFSGVTLNVISLSGLAVGVGMLVDNSIVVIENIYRLRREGVPIYRACVTGASEVAGAVTASTLTTVCVFVPIVFVEGITRQLFADMALTITYSLMASLVIALTLVPAMSSGLLKKTREKPDRLYRKFLRAYEKSLRFTLRGKAIVMILSVVLLILSFVLTISRGFTFMPDMDGDEMSVSVTLPDDATLAETRKISDILVARIRTVPEVQTVGAMSASSAAGMLGISAGGESTNQSTIYIVLNPERDRTSIELEPVIENLCQGLGCETTVTGATGMSSYTDALGGSGVAVNVYANDLDLLTETARAVAERLERVEGLTEVSDGMADNTPALRVTVDKARAMTEGLTVAEVYQHVSSLLRTDSSVTTIGTDSRNVVVQTREHAPTLEEIKNHEITFQDRAGKFKTVRLGEIASFYETESLSAINRNDQLRYLTVTAALEDGYNVTLQTEAAMQALADYEPPLGASVSFSGENETIMNAMKDLLLMMVLGIAIVYLIMVAQFQSLLSPFIVMGTIPLAFTGGLMALYFAGFEISVVGMIGFVMLVGIIVNNGIVLIDAMNRLRAEGMGRREAVVTACMTRLRPVLMTALTTVLGLIPMAMGRGTGASLVQPVAIVAIGGLLYATLMTMYVVPAMYDSMAKKPPRVVTEADLAATEETERDEALSV